MSQPTPTLEAGHAVSALESDPLFSGRQTKETTRTHGQRLMKSFIVTSVSFSVSHAFMTVVMNYNSSAFDLKIASFSTGVINVVFSAVCLMGAAPIVDFLGPYGAIIASLSLYATYLMCLWLALIFENTSSAAVWLLVIIGSFGGGVASGLGFVVQGSNTAATAAAYHTAYASEDNLLTLNVANSSFSGYFALIYSSCQCLAYLAFALLLELTDVSLENLILAAGVAVICTTAVYAAIGASAPDIEPSIQVVSSPKTSSWRRFFAVMKMAVTDSRAICVAPCFVAFGFTSMFISDYVNDETVDDYLGSDAVGYLGAIQSGMTAVLAVAMSHAARLSGDHRQAVAAGALGFGLVATTYLTLTADQVGASGWAGVVCLFFCYALGRASFESSAKAIMADLYPDARVHAYAYLNFVYGISASAYSFSDDYFTGRALAAFLVPPCILMLPGYLSALGVFGDSKQEFPAQ